MGQKIDINKYLGSWYEIARIHNEFEPNMYDVAAKYTLKENGDIEVLNSGYINGKFKSITGIAKTTDKDDVLKVSFVPGVESNYKILAIVDNYDYALVGGDDPNHLWILGRNKRICLGYYSWFIDVAKEHGYNVDNLKLTKDRQKMSNITWIDGELPSETGDYITVRLSRLPNSKPYVTTNYFDGEKWVIVPLDASKVIAYCKLQNINISDFN